VEVSDLVQFVHAASRDLQADLGCIALLTPTEIEFGYKNGTVSPVNVKRTQFNFFIAGHRLQKYLPDIYWLTTFGPPYLDMFGRDRLLSAPVFKAEALDAEHVSLQLTPKLRDLEVNPDGYEWVKRRVKEHLGADAFFDPDRRGECRVPNFVWK
jgi:hypothetical protein